MSETDKQEGDEKAIRRDDVLTFKAPSRPLAPDTIADEFQIIRSFFEKAFTADIAHRVCLKSGTHLIKMVSPRVDGHHCVLRIFPTAAGITPRVIIPSVNAPDCPLSGFLEPRAA
jgi:hypothetical protein